MAAKSIKNQDLLSTPNHKDDYKPHPCHISYSLGLLISHGHPSTFIPTTLTPGKMSDFAHRTPFSSNRLETKSDLQEFLIGLLDPLERHTSPGCARIHVGFTGTHYDETAAQLEGFSRPIWGLASLLHGSHTTSHPQSSNTSSPSDQEQQKETPVYPGASRWVEGLKNGTNPRHVEFWGEMRDKDQRMVECSAIGFLLAVAKEDVWDKLGEEGQRDLENWLGGMNDKEMPNTNWLWFRVRTVLSL